MQRYIVAALGGTLAGALMVTQIAGPLVAQESSRQASVYEQLDLFGDIFERIRSQYVEEVEDADLIEAAINGMLTSLDRIPAICRPTISTTCASRPVASSGVSGSR